ncbi:hypothetical protein MTR67_023767, partial [Solanum verrucosum]
VTVGILIDLSSRIWGSAVSWSSVESVGMFMWLTLLHKVSSSSYAFYSLGRDKLGIRAGRVPGNPQAVSCRFLFMVIIVGNEFLGVFLGELLAISLEQASNFSIDTLRDALPISISPFSIAPAKWKDILYNSFNRTSASLSGAPMLFVRKKDELLYKCIDCKNSE